MTKVSITCPTTWFNQYDWIRDNCKEYIDDTNWDAWQIGLDDIYFYINETDAILFTLLWK